MERVTFECRACLLRLLDFDDCSPEPTSTANISLAVWKHIMVVKKSLRKNDSTSLTYLMLRMIPKDCCVHTERLYRVA